MESKRFRAWALVVWPPAEPQVLDCYRYTIWCSDTTKDGKLHYHQFVYLKNAKTFSAMKKLQDTTTHIEVGSNDYINYITQNKNGRKFDICEHGEPPHQGKTLTGEQVKKMTPGEIAYHDPLHIGAYLKAKSVMEMEEAEKNVYLKSPDVQWHFGSTHSGKSYGAQNSGFKELICDGQKYEDWGSARKLHIEEERGIIPWSDMLKITDRIHNYNKLRILYGHKIIDLDAIWISVSKSPWDTYQKRDENDDIKQLMRRLKWVAYEHMWIEETNEYYYRTWRYGLEDDEPCIIEDWKPYIVERTIPDYDLEE